jgi:hypothetical protein
LASDFLKHASGRFVVRRSAMRRRLCDRDRHRSEKGGPQAAGSAAAMKMTTAAAAVAGTAHRLVVRVDGGGQAGCDDLGLQRFVLQPVEEAGLQCDLNHIRRLEPVLSSGRRTVSGVTARIKTMTSFHRLSAPKAITLGARGR